MNSQAMFVQNKSSLSNRVSEGQSLKTVMALKMTGGRVEEVVPIIKTDKHGLSMG